MVTNSEPGNGIACKKFVGAIADKLEEYKEQSDVDTEQKSKTGNKSGVKEGWKDTGHKTVSGEKNLAMTEYERIRKRPPVMEAGAV